MKAVYKMKAGTGNIEYREVDRPGYAEHEVLVQVKAAGICGSDLHIYNWDTQVPMNPPVIMGHEFSGVVAEVGSAVSDWTPGDRVVVEPSYSVCGRCRNCMEGRYNLCLERRVLGFYTDGGFAEYTVAPAHRLHRLPNAVTFEQGAMSEPMACGVHGVQEQLGIRNGELALVTGPGTIGLLAAQVARANGARVIIVGTDADTDRMAIARRLGFKELFSAGDRRLAEMIADQSAGLGVDVVIEAAGAAAAVRMGLDLIRKGGRFLQLGVFGRPIEVPFETIVYKELTVFGSFAQKWSAWKTTLQLMETGRVDLEPLVTDRLALSEWQTGFDKMNRKEGLKILLIP